MNHSILAKQLELEVPRQIFRAYDIRGNIEFLTEDLVRDIGYALAAMYHSQGQTDVVVGYDARLTSEAYSHILINAFTHSGLNVLHIGCVSSPLLYFSAMKHQGNGVMITASHNPVSDNGIKWLIQHLPPTPDQIQNIADCIEERQFKIAGKVGSIQTQNDFSQYLKYLDHDIECHKNIKVSVDGLYGSAGEIAEKALVQLGCQVDALHCRADGNFPLGAPDPSEPERLIGLRQSVLQHQSAMGIALDGDGDRLVLLDETGQYISPDRIMSLLTKICLLQQPHAEIVCDVKCSSMISQTVSRYSGHLTMIRTGSSFLRNYLYKNKAIFGGEFAGHYVFNDGRGKCYDDGLYAALRILEYLSKTEQSLSEVLSEFPDRISTKDIYIPSGNITYSKLADCFEHNIVSNMQENYMSINKVDGIRLDFPFGFGIIRPSNTGEYFTVRFDADTQQNFAMIQQEFVRALSADFPTIAQAIATAH